MHRGKKKSRKRQMTWPKPGREKVCEKKIANQDFFQQKSLQNPWRKRSRSSSIFIGLLQRMGEETRRSHNSSFFNVAQVKQKKTLLRYGTVVFIIQWYSIDVGVGFEYYSLILFFSLKKGKK